MICIFIFVHFDTFAKSFVLIVSTREGGPLVSSSKLHKSTLPLFHVGMFPEEKAPKDGGLRSQNFMLSTGTSNCCSQFFSKTCMCNIYIYIFLFCIHIYIYIHVQISPNTWLQVTALIPYTSFQNDDDEDVAVLCRHDAMATLSELWRLEDAPGRIQVHQPKKKGYRTSKP